MSPGGYFTINDPEVVNDILILKHRLVDKNDKFKRGLKRFIGQSILFENSTDLWAEKRKHLSASFYKDKLNVMLRMIIGITN